MKILRISLRNIASLEGTHTVDFTQEPLRSAGLFAICGPTGAGKSTLLDALCLALYEQTPRLHAVKSGPKLQDGTTLNSVISQKDAGNLLRRGTGEGFAEVAFAGVDNTTYTARWQIRRARGQADKPLQSPEMSLLKGDVPYGCEGESLFSGKKTEVLAAIQSRIGLSFEQFTRAVLLAQNDFATFLRADDKDRAEILQALTSTERFEAISRLVYARCAQEEKALQSLEARLHGIVPLVAEERTAAETRSREAQQQVDLIAGQLDTRKAQVAWFARHRDLEGELRKGEAELETARQLQEQSAGRQQELQQTEEISAGARSLREAEVRLGRDAEHAGAKTDAALKAEQDATCKEAAAREKKNAAWQKLTRANAEWEAVQVPLRTARELDVKLDERQEQLATATREHTESMTQVAKLKSRCDQLQDEIASAESRLQELTPRLTERQQLAPFAAELSTWTMRMATATAEQKKLQETKVLLKGSAAQVEKTLSELAEAQASAREAEKEVEAQTLSLQAAQANLSTYDSAALLALRDEATAWLGKWRQQEELTTLLEPLSRAHEFDLRALGKARTQLPQTQQAWEHARQAHRTASAAVEDATLVLREGLAAGQPCPVCGAEAHPYSTHPPAYEAAALRALQAECARLESETTRLLKEEAGLAKACEVRNAEIAHKQQALQELGLSGGTADGKAQWTEALERADSEIAALRKAQEEREQLREKWLSAQEKTSGAEKSFATLQTKRAGEQAHLEGAEKTLQVAQQRARMAAAEVTSLLSALPELKSQWERDAEEALAQFKEDAEAYLQLEKMVAELRSQIQQAAASLRPTEEALVGAEQLCASKRNTEEQQAADLARLQQERTQLFQGEAADAVEVRLKQAQSDATWAHEASRREADEWQKALAVAQTNRASSAATLESLCVQLQEATRALHEWLKTYEQRTALTLDRAGLDERLERDEGWIREERAALQALTDRVRTAGGGVAVLRDALGKHEAVRLTAEEELLITRVAAQLREEKAAAEGLRDEARATLLADDDRLQQSAALLQELTLAQALARPLQRLNDLIGSADGAKFRNIAQRSTLDILLGYTNRQLALLASRYRLERIPESLNLLVVDGDMADERRSVHSLSGGESFLVSLSLALGLASLTSHRLRIESLFIDEGFGSLDQETLSTAMAALMRLEAQGRKVGVISHVSEMADAIPTQIRVEKRRSGASRLTGAGVTSQEPSPQPSRPADLAAAQISAQILQILTRAQTTDTPLVSIRALRQELACGPAALQSALDLLSTQVTREARSVRLTDERVAEAEQTI